MSGFIKTGVIGYPVKHSKSPRIHNAWIKKYGLSGAYDAIEIAPGDLAPAVAQLVADGYAGFNVTIPHKEQIMTLCDDVSDEAKAIGAVNTVSIESGKLYGHNTDAFGFTENIKSAIPDFSFAGKTALVLGAGGAAKAVLYGLIQEHAAHIIITNRTKDRAAKLIEAAPNNAATLQVIDWEKRSKNLDMIDIIINTTALGMEGQPPLEMDVSALKSGALVNDIVYAPLHTKLLQQAEAQNALCVSGIGMLLHQARPAFKKWYGIMPEVDEALVQEVLV